MSTNGQLLRKLAEGQTLLESEIMQLERALDGYDNFASLLQSHSVVGSRELRVEQNFEVLYSKVLEVDTTSIQIALPAVFRTILIYGSGSITSANGGNIWAQFNGDTGNNYMWQALAVTPTVTGFQDTSDPFVAIGLFGTTGAGAGVNGSFRAEIVHAHGGWKKNVLAQCYTAEFNDLYLMGSTWQNTNPIETMEIFGTDNTLVKGSTNIAAGSLLSVYGLR